MSKHLMGLVSVLQVLFTTTASQLGKSIGFIQRQRKLKADAFAQTLVFQWMADPKTTLESMADELKLSPQALQQHLGPAAQKFLLALLAEALQSALQIRPERLRLLNRFTAVIVEDTTTIKLPADLAKEFPGCGGGSAANEGAAALKVLLRWDIRTGQVWALSVHAGRTSDQTLAATASDLPEGSLHLADQGFFNTQRWDDLSATQYWISRVPARTLVCCQGLWQSLGALLSSVRENLFDGTVLLVEKTKLRCRLVAQRCPEEVANRRRQKLREYTRSKKGREPSAEQLLLCGWLVFATNTTAKQLGPQEMWVIYRCRWQVELLFKRAKQLAGWGHSSGHKGDRVLVELYAKLLGWVILHWSTLLAGGPLNGVSMWKKMKAVQKFAERIQDSLAQGLAALLAVFEKLAQRLARIRPQAKSNKKPTTRQLLRNPELASQN